MYSTTVHPSVTTELIPAESTNTEGPIENIRTRALSFMCTLYRCDLTRAAEILRELSQSHNLRTTVLATALVHLIDADRRVAMPSGAIVVASHFWLREIRRIKQIDRRTDRLARHLCTHPGGTTPRLTAERCSRR